MATWDQQAAGALKGEPTGKGEPTPLYDPTSKKFIGWQYPSGATIPQPSSQGAAPDWYPGTTQAAAAATPGAAAGTQSYLSPGGGSNMTWAQIGQQYGFSQADLNSFQQQGFSPDQVSQSYQTTGGPPKAAAAATPQQNAFGITSKDSGKGYATLTANNGQTINVDNAGNYFTTDANGNNTPVSDIDAQKMGFQSTNPETQALKQLGQIDPTSEALRKQVASSYADPNQRATAADYQSYLDTFKQVDPEEYAQRAGLATSMDSYLKSAQDEAALGSQLDPVSQMQIEQQARKAQADRGNLYGSGQAAVEAMTTGQAGQALKQQRQQALSGALGQQQSYLGAGLGIGDTAMGLYQQGLSNKANQQQGALSYLSSGQTPYQAGASYLSNAEGTAGSAAQGGPQYNPASLGTSYSGSATAAPQYGLNTAQSANSWYNSLSAYSGGQGASTKNQTGAALGGALSGAASGAMAGSAAGPYGTLIGGAVGAVGGGLSGYYS